MLVATQSAPPRFLRPHQVGRQHDVGAAQLAKLGEQSPGAMPQPSALCPLFEGLPQDVGEKADQDVSLDPAGFLMPNRSQRQVRLLDAKGSLDLGELNVGVPELLGCPVGDVGAQYIAAFTDLRPVIPLGAHRPGETQAARLREVSGQLDVKALGGAAVSFEQSPNLTID